MAWGRNSASNYEFNLLVGSERCVALCDRQPGWHLGTVFIIHSEVAAVQQLFLRSAPLSSPSPSVCQKAELMSAEEEDLNICPHSRNVAVISNVGALHYFLFFFPPPVKAAFKCVFVFRTLVAAKRCVFDPPLNWNLEIWRPLEDVRSLRWLGPSGSYSEVWKVKQHIKPVHVCAHRRYIVCAHRRYIALITGYESAWVSTQVGRSRCSSGLQEPDALLALLNVSRSSFEGLDTSDLLFSWGRNRLTELGLRESRLSDSILNLLQQTSTC